MAEPTQPGYNRLAERYAQTFTTAYTTALEHHAIEAFAAWLHSHHTTPIVVDVGCGIGHVAAHMTQLGSTVIGVDPSSEMLRLARLAHPELDLRPGDATLTDVDLTTVDAILARFSLIHLSPASVAATLVDWHRRLRVGAALLIAAQSSDEPGSHPFDHAVAPAWRWHPDTLASVARDAGFNELWRTVSRPSPQHRFPEVHLMLTAAPVNT